MNPTNTPTPATTAEISLTRQEKVKLLQKMYSLPHWIAIIRLFGYQVMPMDRAREEIKPIAEEYGKEPVANACEVMVEIHNQGNVPFARLKPHIRRMAFQILGPEPQPGAVVPAAAPPPTPDATTQSARQAERRKPRKLAETQNPPTPATTQFAGENSGSAVMQQYRKAKERHPNMLLLFRMGDFYELFAEDAETAHKLLGLTLTTRDRTLPMAGFPHHQLEAYLHKLLQAGQRVAICEPAEESLAQGSIRREVTRVVTPEPTTDEIACERRRAKRQKRPRAK